MRHGRHGITRAARRVLLLCAVALAALISFVMLFEDRFIYIPTRGGVGPSPGEEVRLNTADGVSLHGWFVTHPAARVTLLWLHGNAGNIEDRRDLLMRLTALPANVLLIDYRGYGKSGGTPSEDGLYADARTAWDWLVRRVEPDRIVIFGVSLGGAPACELATRVRCGGLILQSAFTSAKDMAGRVVRFFPVRWFMHTDFDNLAKIGRIPAPKLILHGRQDQVVPFSMGERLFEAAAEPRQHAWFEAAGHDDLATVGGVAYFTRLRRFLAQIGG